MARPSPPIRVDRTVAGGSPQADRGVPAVTRRPILDDAGKAAHRLGFLTDLRKEHVVALYLNSRHQELAFETISIGTLTASLIHPREVFGPALRCSAASVLV